MDGTRAGLRYPFETPPEPGEAIEVADGILWLRQPLPMKLDHVNIYALDDGDSWCIIDTGMHTRKSVAMWEKALTGPLGGKPVSRVIVTHHHPDHVGNAGWFQSEHGAQLWTTRTSWLFARMLLLDSQDRPTAETLEFYRRAGMAPEIFDKRREERPFNYADIVAPMPLGFQRVAEGDVVQMGGRTWDVRIGNGHAPEHATFWSRSDSVILAGDQILSSISPNIGVYATEPEADPLSGWMEACTRFQTFAREDHLVLGGHKLPFTGLPMRLGQLIDNHHGALRRLRSHLKTPHTAGECFAPLFKRSIGAGEYGLALVEAVAHMNHLWHLGEVRRVCNDAGAWTYQMQGEQM